VEEFTPKFTHMVVGRIQCLPIIDGLRASVHHWLVASTTLSSCHMGFVMGFDSWKTKNQRQKEE
jgi:hypothetical protein